MKLIRSLQLPSAAFLFLAPAVNLVWRGGTGYSFFALLALALGAAIANRHTPGYFAGLRIYRWYTVGMSAFIIAIAVQQTVFHFWLPRQFDALSRFPLALLIFLFLRQMPTRHLKSIGWGCVVGAIAVGIAALIDQPPGGWGDAHRMGNWYTNPIPFGDTALLLAFLSLFTLGWDNPPHWRTLVPRLLALLGGGCASIASGTRGGWLAIPVFVILLAAQYRWFAHKIRFVALVVVLVLASAATLSLKPVQQRIADVTSDLTMARRGVVGTSIGERQALWEASGKLFVQHPLYGIGKGHLSDVLNEMSKQGKSPPEIVNERAHSDFFSTLAELGLVGVACLFLFYFGISVYFWRERHATDPTIRAASYAGLAVATSTVIFGLTIDVLVPVMVTSLLALMVATLLAVIDARKRELAAVRQARPLEVQADDIRA
ncbi:O-antigen ligase [Paraburkholderia sp.]|uniref:O-antigen ligase family protein n=1 Tax=Paraburkholderia sp. TaxID=1926495 RepID=UPI0025E0D092|nr:O-antigen ligase family protein [Paraburkholderia sp.]